MRQPFPLPPAGWPQQITQFLQQYFTRRENELDERIAKLEARIKQLEER